MSASTERQIMSLWHNSSLYSTCTTTWKCKENTGQPVSARGQNHSWTSALRLHAWVDITKPKICASTLFQISHSFLVRIILINKLITLFGKGRFIYTVIFARVTTLWMLWVNVCKYTCTLKSTHFVLGLCGKGLGAGRQQGSCSCPTSDQSQLQPAPKGTRCWPQLSQ